MSQVQLEPARQEHLPWLATSLAKEALFLAYKRDAQSLQRGFEAALRRDSDRLLVALDPQDRPLGICWFLPVGTFASGAYLKLLAVVPQMQKQGIGALLLQAYEAACSDSAGGLFLLCSDFNTAAQAFYTAHGYRRAGTLPDFAVPGITEYIYHKPQTS